jgi:hypothetical protein
MRSLSSPRAVSMMIGRLRVSARPRRRRQTSMPDSLGSIQSSRTRSGWRSSIWTMPSSPSDGDDDVITLLLEIVLKQGRQGVLVFHHQDVWLHVELSVCLPVGLREVRLPARCGSMGQAGIRGAGTLAGRSPILSPVIS